MGKTLILGGDVSKGYADFIALNAVRDLVGEPFQLADNTEGHKDFVKRLSHWRDVLKYTRIVVVVESTGGYEDNWLRCVRQERLCEGYRINPKVTHHEYRIQQRNSVTDRVSASTIAQHVVKNLDNFYPREHRCSDDLIATRGFIRQIIGLEKSMASMKNGLEKLLYRYMPSLLAIKSDGWSDYMLNIIVNYGGKKSIQKAASQGFKKISRVPKGFADRAHEALKNGVDINDTPAMAILDMQSKAQTILHLEASKDKLTKQLIDLAPVDKEQLELLCSINGMGKRSAAVFLAYIGSVERFESAPQIAAFFGVTPRLKSSGDSSPKAHMSKQGNAVVRRELYLLAFRVLSTEPYFKAIYTQQRNKGMCHDAALGVLMHKLIRVMYGMLINKTTFDAGIDQLNQAKQERPNQATKTKETSKVAVDVKSALSAPLSSRKRKKLKADYESQAATVAESAGSS